MQLKLQERKKLIIGVNEMKLFFIHKSINFLL